jgi:outer membrane receptor for ferrienterochelin and colicins
MIKHVLLWVLFFSIIQNNFAQNTFQAIVKDRDSKEPIIGATAIVQGANIGAVTDSNGRLVLENVPNGKQVILLKSLGFNPQSINFVFPFSQEEPFLILMEPQHEDLEEVIISSMRSSRTISDLPTRVEFIAGEELEEKANMRAGDIRLILSESTGIQVQQTSATSANASIRIQGLDGRYTQLLKDGFPIFAGAASGLGLLQTPPLDLQQVEVIKGSASTLYGGGAIAGLVNLISKSPTEVKDFKLHLNGSSGGGFDINGYFGQRFGKVGTTIFASHHRNWAYDPANIQLTAIPKFERYVFNPKIFLYFNEKTTLNVGINSAIENRIGGQVDFIRGKREALNSYFEENKTARYSTQSTLQHQIDDRSKLIFKNSISYFNRQINIPNYQFQGTQIASFSEASYVQSHENVEWISGLNLWTDDFKESRTNNFPLRDYQQNVFGAFVQNIWKAKEWLHFETGMRGDHVWNYGWAFLPRFSALFKFTDQFTSRIGGGMGYKAPTIFTEESERLQYQNVLPINQNTNLLERSYGGNIDFNFRGTIGDEVSVNINQLFFYTYLNQPLLLQNQGGNIYRFVNSIGHVDSRGAETNIKLGYEDFKLFLGYTFTDARLYEGANFRENPLTPKHRINSVLMYEVEEKWKIGLEAYYFSPQRLSDEAIGQSYVLCGFMAEKLWENFSIYINFENFLDARQTRFDTIYTGNINNPTFRDIYAPLDGFLINGGLKIKL